MKKCENDENALDFTPLEPLDLAAGALQSVLDHLVLLFVVLDRRQHVNSVHGLIIRLILGSGCGGKLQKTRRS